MSTPVTLQYRIKNGGGTLFVRESIRGEIIARIESEYTTTDPESVEGVMAKCQGVFSGEVKTVRHEDDCVYVTSVILPNNAAL